eukprot:g14485.t1
MDMEFVRGLGRGAFGEVKLYRRAQQEFAVKELSLEGRTEADAATEARTLAGLPRHEHIVNVLDDQRAFLSNSSTSSPAASESDDDGPASRHPRIFMEYAPGGELTRGFGFSKAASSCRTMEGMPKHMALEVLNNEPSGMANTGVSGSRLRSRKAEEKTTPKKKAEEEEGGDGAGRRRQRGPRRRVVLGQNIPAEGCRLELRQRAPKGFRTGFQRRGGHRAAKPRTAEALKRREATASVGVLRSDTVTGKRQHLGGRLA